MNTRIWADDFCVELTIFQEEENFFSKTAYLRARVRTR